MKQTVLLLLLFVCSYSAQIAASAPRVLQEGELPADSRLGPLRQLGRDYFPLQQVESLEEWKKRANELRRQVRVATGIWPHPSKTPLDASVHTPIEREDYTVWRVYFQSFPGHFVTGSLYRPKNESSDRRPAVLCPHGHWANGRFHDHGDKKVKEQISIGAERFLVGGRYPLQSRCVQLARMGCVVFLYDMDGYADSVQRVNHRNGVRDHMNAPAGWGLTSPQAELRLQNLMGLQTWNSIRAFDFLSSLPDVDPSRIVVTGASGGGTQTFVLMAVDERPAAAVPCVMVSTAMQGGCNCENAPYLRIGAGNIDLAALAAPRPMGLTAADDWTVELETKGYPDLKQVYGLYGMKDLPRAVFHSHFKHNYNSVNRMFMYGCVNDFLDLGFEKPILERDYVPLAREEATVWDDDHPAPKGDQIGEPHEKALLRWWAEDSDRQLGRLKREDSEAFATLIRGAWDVMIGQRLDDVADVQIADLGSATFGDYQGRLVTINAPASKRQLPAIFLLPGQNAGGKTVVWLTDDGKSGLMDAEGNPTAAVRNLLEAGHTVVGVDLLYQGEFLADGARLTKQPMNIEYPGDTDDKRQPWEYFSGYTYGYNRPLFSLRVQDVLATVCAIRSAEQKTNKISLVGQGREAGTISVAARLQAGSIISKTIAVTDGFRFASVDRFDDPMFLPGAVKYGDLPGLTELIGDSLLWLDEPSTAFLEQKAAPWIGQ